LGHALKYMSNGHLARRRRANELRLTRGTDFFFGIMFSGDQDSGTFAKVMPSLLLRGQPLHPRDTSDSGAVTSHEQPNSCRHPWEYGWSSTAPRWSGDCAGDGEGKDHTWTYFRKRRDGLIPI
jgi:hypothetical protein